MTQLPQDRRRPQMPARPAQRRFAVHVFGIDERACIEQQLDGLFGAKGSRAMLGAIGFSQRRVQRSFAGVGIGAIRVGAVFDQELA